MKYSKVAAHKRQLESHLRDIEEINGTIMALLNKMFCDSDFVDIHEDVVFALNNNFRAGQYLLGGLLDVIDEQYRRKPKAA